jgi:hypothetical protein
MDYKEDIAGSFAIGQDAPVLKYSVDAAISILIFETNNTVARVMRKSLIYHIINQVGFIYVHQ